MSTTAILEAFATRLDAFTYSPQPPIAWPGVKFKPPASGMWLEASLFPGDPESLAWENDSPNEVRGFCQILIGYRPGLGEVAASQLADALLAWFAKGTPLGPVRVSRTPTRAPSLPDEGNKIFIPVTIPYLAIVAP